MPIDPKTGIETIDVLYPKEDVGVAREICSMLDEGSLGVAAYYWKVYAPLRAALKGVALSDDATKSKAAVAVLDVTKVTVTKT